MHPVQEAFNQERKVSSGFWTPGMITAAIDLQTHPTDEQIRIVCGRNLRRCTGYQNVVRAGEWRARGEERRTHIKRFVPPLPITATYSLIAAATGFPFATETLVVRPELSGGKRAMAEIRVEPQQRGRGRLWLLILLLIVIVVAGWYFASRRTAAGTATASSPAPATAPAKTP